jgi:hypothetical protein
MTLIELLVGALAIALLAAAASWALTRREASTK